jgi:CO/xanthine dehydrogenase FAD-binding subunit
MVIGAEFVLKSARGDRVVRAEDFFLGYMTTAIEPNEILTEIRISAWKPGVGWAVDEVARRKGDFAIVGVAVLLQINGNDICQDVRIALFGVGGRPVRMQRAESMLRGRGMDQRALADIAMTVSEDLDPDSDVHASAEYRKEVGGVITRRALEKALLRAREGKKQ